MCFKYEHATEYFQYFALEKHGLSLYKMPEIIISSKSDQMMPMPRGYKTFFMLNSTEHEIYTAHKC